MLDGLASILGFEYLVYLFVGVFVGIAVGALPGFTATMGTALVLPFTFVLDAGVGIGMLGALYVAAMYADSIPACLVNTPGTPSALTTAFDGYPLTQKGEGQKALVASAFSAFFGATVGGLMFLFLAPPLAAVALEFGPPEFFWLGVFALTIIGGIAGDSLLKGAAGGVIGLLVSTIGLSTTAAVSRFNFGLTGLRGGVSLVAGLIGIFALPQVLSLVSERRMKEKVAEVTTAPGVTWQTVKEIMRRPGNVLRSSVIGGAVGILPGAGGPMATLVSYNEALRWSKDRREFGKGSVHGVVASEAAGSGAAGGSMVPMMALGVPGSGPAAVILGALLLKGIRPGPSMFAVQPELVYGFAWSVILAGLVTFIVGSIVARPIAKMVTVPVRLLVPIILLLSVVGSFAIRSNMSDVYMMLVLGVLVYFLSMIGFHPGPFGLGLILGPIIEPALVQSIALTRTSSFFEIFFGRPVSIVLILLSTISAGWVLWSHRKGKRLTADEDALESSHDKPEGRSVSESVLCAIAMFVIGGLFLFNSGTEVQDWILPLVLTAFLILAGTIFLIQAAMGRGGDPVWVKPPLLRRRGADVTAVVVFMIAYVSLAEAIGFWLMSALAVFVVSVYLTNERNRKAIAISGIVALVVSVAMYFLMIKVFYVPFPSFQLF